MRIRILYISLSAALAAAQTPPSQLQFEAASVKPLSNAGPDNGLPIGGPGSLGGRPDPSLIRYPGFSLKYLLTLSYGIQAYQITCPAWAEFERYEIVAKVPPGAAKDQVRLMLRNLVVERFHIVVRHEKKEMPIYALVIGKNGSKLKESTEDPNPPDDSLANRSPNYPVGKDGFPQPPRSNSGGINIMFGGPGRIRISSMLQPLSEFARVLSLQLGRPVVDETGLHGKYDFNVDFTPAEDQPLKGPSGEDLPMRRPPVGQEGPDIFAAIQTQLGRKLESRKGSVDLLIIQHADRVPADNQ